MPNISSFPGGSGFASKLMDHDENKEMLKIKSRPRIVTPSQPIEAPMEQPLSINLRIRVHFYLTSMMSWELREPLIRKVWYQMAKCER